MSNDYSTCSSCNLGYRDDSDYACFCECGENFHSKECGKLKNFKEYDEDDEDFEENCTVRIDKSQPVTCCICRKEKYTNDILLDALLKHYNITIKDAVKIWKSLP